MFGNMKIGVRLGAGFGSLIVLMGILVAVAVVRVSKLNGSIEVVVQDRMTKVRQANALVDGLNEYSRVLRNLVLASDSAVIATEDARRDGISSIMSANLDSLERNVVDGEGRSQLALVNESRAPYREQAGRIAALAKGGKDAEATEMLFGDFRIVQNHYISALKKFSSYQDSLARADGNAAARLASNTAQMLLVFAVLALLAGILAAWWITLSITRPLGRCIEIAEKVSRGETDLRIDVTSRDETGILLGAMKRMIEAIQRMGGDATMLSKAAVEGRLATRADATKHEGDFRKIVQGVNDTLDAVIGPLNVTARYVDDISKGVIPATITDNYNGDFNLIKNNLNAVVKMMSELLKETDTLVNAALNGSLSTRASANLFVGGWNQLVAGINKTLDSVLEPINEAASVLEKVSARDLTSRMKGDYKGDHAKIKVSLNMAVDNLDKALGQVGQATLQVSSAAQQISAGSQALAQGSNEQASSLEEVSSSLEEMASMTRQNADNSIQAKNLASEADTNARSGGESMKRMNTAIVKIKDSSDQTAKIVKTIDEIAMQTNLLALNAAVEAARAGEAGRGFAVVAEEVRNLAQRSAQAAKSTADMIGESVKNADDGVKIAQEVAKSFESIAISSRKVNDLIGEIASASKEQSQGIDQVNTAVSQMDKVTQQTAANAEESASSAEELSSQAEELQSMVEQFRITAASNAVAMIGAGPVHRPVAIAHGGHKRAAHPVKRNVVVDPEQVIPMNDDALREF